MKSSQIFRSVAIAIILALLIIAVPATPALAAVTVSPYSGTVGTSISVSGTGFTANNPYTITFAYGTPFSSKVGNGIVGNNGEIPPTAFSVPVIPGGAYTIRVETFGDTAEHVSRSFLIVPKINIDRSYGYVGNQAGVDGTGFAAGNYDVGYYDGAGSQVLIALDENVAVSGNGTLYSEYLLTTDVTATGDDWWHALVQPAGALNPLPNDYATAVADPDGYELLANDSFYVAESAIPEFPTVMAAIMVAGLCAGIYYWMRKRKLAYVKA